MHRSSTTRRLVALVLSVFLVAACSDDGTTRATLFPLPTPDRSVVAIRATGCRRTSTKSAGVVVAPQLVVTVAHSVAGEDDIEVQDAGGRVFPANVAAIDPRLDLAVLRVEALELASVPIAMPDPGVATFVAFPDGSTSSEVVVIRRLVDVRTSDIFREGVHLRPGFELGEASVEPGDSGGGVFQAGALVGIVWGTSRIEGARAWATDIAAYERLIATASRREEAPPISCTR